MKGYVKVDRVDLLSAIIGFGIKNDLAKDARKKGIQGYYDKNYVNGNLFVKHFYKGVSATQFIYRRTGCWYIYSHYIKEFLTDDEIDLVNWMNTTSSSLIEPLKSLYNAGGTGHDYVLVDDELAAVITKYKNYLENTQ